MALSWPASWRWESVHPEGRVRQPGSSQGASPGYRGSSQHGDWAPDADIPREPAEGVSPWPWPSRDGGSAIAPSMSRVGGSGGRTRTCPWWQVCWPHRKTATDGMWRWAADPVCRRGPSIVCGSRRGHRHIAVSVRGLSGDAVPSEPGWGSGSAGFHLGWNSSGHVRSSPLGVTPTAWTACSPSRPTGGPQTRGGRFCLSVCWGGSAALPLASVRLSPTSRCP